MLAAIARIERRRWWPGDAGVAFARWRALAYRPGHWVLYTVTDGGACPCCDPLGGTDGRLLLEQLCLGLPPGPARALRAALAPVDARFLARTLPDPFASPHDPWWQRRIETA